MSLSLIKSLRFSDLPDDICQLIFGLIAQLDQETARSCALVSRKVNAWIDPIIYRTLIIEHEEQLGSLCGIVEAINRGSSMKSPNFFATHVKAIVITNDRPQYAANILSILKACHNVEILALWNAPKGRDLERSPGTDLWDLRNFMISPELSPRWVSITSNIFPLDEVHFSYPIFQNATHVELVWEERDGEVDVVRWDTLQHLPCLTHFSAYFSFYFKGCYQWVQETVNLCPRSLRVFMFWIDRVSLFFNTGEVVGKAKAIHDGDVDGRAVAAYMGDSLPTNCDLRPILRSYNDVVRDCAGVPVGKDFWTLAEEFIEERHRRRETQDTSSAA